MTKSTTKTAIVFGGGGARGAYEAGVLHYLRNQLAADLGFQPQFDILSGTSVGAINACHMAMTAHDPKAQVKLLQKFWSQLELNKVFQLTPAHLFKMPRWLMGQVDGRMSIVLTEPLEQLVTRGGCWGNIKRNISAGHLQALMLTATRVSDGLVTVFYQAQKGLSPDLAGHPHLIPREARIGPRHALASAAIPLLFPAVPINGQLYYDGGLLQNTPLLPALSLGAQKVLVISIGQRWSGTTALEDWRTVPQKERGEMTYPSAPMLFGKMLDALLVDQVEPELERLRQTNALLQAARDKYGQEFVEKLTSLDVPLAGRPMRSVQELCLEPSEDIGAIATQHIKGATQSAGGLAGQFIQRLSDNPSEDDGHMPSIFLFHGPYAKDLISLAKQDCASQHNRLLDFFGNDESTE